MNGQRMLGEKLPLKVDVKTKKNNISLFKEGGNGLEVILMEKGLLLHYRSAYIDGLQHNFTNCYHPIPLIFFKLIQCSTNLQARKKDSHSHEHRHTEGAFWLHQRFPYEPMDEERRVGYN